MSTLLKQLLLPPASLIFILLVGLILFRKRWDIGWWMATISGCLIYFLATPIGSGSLSGALETYSPLPMGDLPAGQAQAIVILGSDSDYAVELGGETVGSLTLARLRYGARLHSRTGLPILVSGGPLEEDNVSLAEKMGRTLAQDFGISGVWEETHSRNTWQNAVDSTAILRAKNIARIYLVTNARDMMRASRAFQQIGVTVIPAPIGFTGAPPSGVRMVSPSAEALLSSYYALYEIVGGLEYRLIHPHADGAARGD